MLYLTEQDVDGLIGINDAITVVRGAFAALGRDEAMNVPRSRAKAPGIVLHNMHAAAGYLGFVGAKLYTTTRQGARFLVLLFEAESGELAAMIEADRLGQLRTGAASGVATMLLARPTARTVGVIGTGHQAQTQLEAVCAVRDIERAFVFSRDSDRRNAFARGMSEALGLDVRPAASPDECVAESEILVTATTSKTPVFDGTCLNPGTHLNIVGSNDLRKTEIDLATISRADTIVCDSREACRIEAGDFVPAIIAGITHYEAMTDLADLVTGKAPGRGSDESLTLFKSVGLAIEDVALAAEIYARATAQHMERTVCMGDRQT